MTRTRSALRRETPVPNGGTAGDPTLITLQRRPEEHLLDAILAAADLALDEIEYQIGLETIGAVAYDYDDDRRIPADWLVREIEKNIGLGLDEAQFGRAVQAAQAVLDPPVPAPDAHLEMAYEDRFGLLD